MKRTLLCLSFLLVFNGCAGDPVEEKEEQEHAVEFKAGLKRRAPILRSRGFTQFRDLRRNNFLVPVAFLEADLVLRVSASGKGAIPSGPDDVLVLPCIAARLAQLANDGYYIAIISNQPVIATKSGLQDRIDKTMFAT